MNPEGASLAYGYAGMGRYIAPDPGAENEDARNGICPFHVAQVFEKALMLGTGQAPVKRYNEYLRGVIVNGRAKPSQIVSHHIRIDEA